jgi:F420-dependent oxidoreductase-like protein
MIEVGLDCSQHQLTWDELKERVLYAESAGFDGAWVFDHFKALYGDPAGPCLEGWTLLAGLAAVTEKIRLGPLVTGVTYRHPSILATEVVTADHISHGRIELAIGAAWNEEEHVELGIDFPPIRERVERLEEAITIMKLLMTEDGASFDGDHYRLKAAAFNPKPVQQPHPPIWVGAAGEKLMLPLVARQADVWHGMGSLQGLVRKSRVLDEHAEKAGRDPAAIRRATSLSLSEPWDEVRARAEELKQAGFTYLTADWPSEGRRRVDEFIADVMPEIKAD